MKKSNWLELTAVTMVSASVLLNGLDLYFKPHNRDPGFMFDTYTLYKKLVRHEMEEIDRLHREGCQ